VDILGLLIRVVVGSLFLYAGAAKAVNLLAGAQAIAGYDLLPGFLLWPTALGFACLETALGALLLLGLWTRFAAAVIALLSAVFLVVLVQAKVRGLHISCGCFGGDGSGTGVTWLDLLREPPILAAAVFLAGREGGPLRLDPLLDDRCAGSKWPKDSGGRWLQVRWIGPIALVTVIAIASFAVPMLSGWTVAAAESNGEVSTTGSERSGVIPAGGRIPDFSAPALGGGTVSWSAYQGIPTVLIVWAPWCPNCQEELPLLARLVREFPALRLVGIATAVEGASVTPDEVMRSHGLDFPVAVDSKDERLAAALGVAGFPTVYYVKADGEILQVTCGAAPEALARSLMEAIASAR
jgi:thiol-disulfide isomerase/thioredoxin/uncharacterized membrane protein YphA (DoxX/SURF4 family)